MKNLNLTNIALEQGFEVNENPPKNERVLQFGGGNFLRGFVDFFIDEANESGLFDGSICIVESLKSTNFINEQEGLYTVLLRGIESGNKSVRTRVITSVSRSVKPRYNYKTYLGACRNRHLRFVVSNTTEAGIVYEPSCKLNDKPPASFPAKITQLLHERYQFFRGDKSKGLIFIPCELIDNNGDTLLEIVLKHAEDWKLNFDFIAWIKENNYFANTLVDRIVSGYPEDANELLPYEDKLLVTAEPFGFFAIEGHPIIKEEFPLDKLSNKIIFTDDVTPYKERKVRILNGGHTMSSLAALLGGKKTVGDIMGDELFTKFLHVGIYEEIIPTLNLPKEELFSFAKSVFERFENPFIKHNLTSIALNSVSKFKARLIPSILDYYPRGMPKALMLSFAALIVFYKGDLYEPNDDSSVINFFSELWKDNDYRKIAEETCKNKDFWGVDLSLLDGFVEKTEENIKGIIENTIISEVEKIL